MSLKMIGLFFLNTWLWGMTWGMYHVLLNILITLLLLKIVGRLRLIPSILFGFFSNVFSFALYKIIILFLVFVVKFQYVPPSNPTSINVLSACISLGLVYAAFQSIFFMMVNKFYSLSVRITTLIVFTSNVISALLMYNFLEIN